MGSFKKYDIIGTTILESYFPTKFVFSSYFKETYPERIPRGYEEEFKELGMSKTTKKGQWNRTTFNIDYDMFLEKLDYSMHEKRFLVSVDRDNLPSFNVPITDNVLCTIHPGYANDFNVWGEIRSIKTKGQSYVYNKIWNDLKRTDYHPYSHIVHVLEELNILTNSFEENRKIILETARVKSIA